MLYEMLAGRPPFTGESPVAIAYKQVNETPVPPSRRNGDVPPRLDAVVMRALSKNPANRYQNAQEFSEDLGNVIKGQEVKATPLLPGGGDATQVIARPPVTAILPPQEEPQGSGRKVWLGILIGILIVAILGGGAYLLVNSLTKKTATVTTVVPEVVGKQYDAAKSYLESFGLKVQDPPTYVVSDKAAGTVLSQDPAKGTKVDNGATIVLTVAKARPTVDVPPLKGLTVAQAQTALQAVGLQLSPATTASSSTVKVGPDHQLEPRRRRWGKEGLVRGRGGLDRAADGHGARPGVRVPVGERRGEPVVEPGSGGSGGGAHHEEPRVRERGPDRRPGAAGRHQRGGGDHRHDLAGHGRVALPLAMTLWFATETFTPEERAVLAPHFTNLDGPVFALVNLPEVVKGALFARYSRTPKSLRRLFLDEFAKDVQPDGSFVVDR